MSNFRLFYGTMGSGKSTYVLQLRHTLEREGFKPILLKPSFDTRDEEFVRSRIGIEHPAVLIGPNEDLFAKRDILSSTHIIVDEAQFLSDKNIDDLAFLADHLDKNVDCFGLRTAYTGRLFDATAYLMAIVDELVELPMTYKDGKKSIMHVRYVDGKPIFSGKAEFVGDIDEEYESVSRKQWMLLKNK